MASGQAPRERHSAPRRWAERTLGRLLHEAVLERVFHEL